MEKRKAKKGEAIKIVLDRLEKGPATPSVLEDDLGLNHSAVMNILRDSIPAKIGLIKQLSDGKYAVKWHSSEENDVKSSYNLLKRKLLREPTPEEISGLIKCVPNHARDLLFKYIPGYREPTVNEIALSSRNLYKTIVWGSIEPLRKSELYEKDIFKLIAKGIDKETLNEILRKQAISLFE